MMMAMRCCFLVFVLGLCQRASSRILVQDGVNKRSVAARTVRDIEHGLLRSNALLRGTPSNSMRFVEAGTADPNGEGGTGEPMSGDLSNQIAGDKTVASNTDPPEHKSDGEVEDSLRNALRVSPNTQASTPMKASGDLLGEGYIKEQEQVLAEDMAGKNAMKSKNDDAWSEKGWAHESKPEEGGEAGTGDDEIRKSLVGSGAGLVPVDDKWTVDALDMLKNQVEQKEIRVEITKEQTELELQQKEEEELSLDAQIAAARKQIKELKSDNSVLKAKIAQSSAKEVNMQARISKFRDEFS